ncbi:hypothetical protein IWX64_003281 [Arthrobacter sp. CAN_A212]
MKHASLQEAAIRPFGHLAAEALFTVADGTDGIE